MTDGVTICGFASSTQQIDALSPSHIVPEVHAICIAGGSAYGLDAARNETSKNLLGAEPVLIRASSRFLVPSTLI